MLHILWMLIKFILIVLGILLGLVLLAILLLLFDPVRYRAEVKKEATGLEAVWAYARVSWLFGLISLRASYADGAPGISLRIFGISFEKLKGFLSRKKSAASASAPAKKTKNRKHAGQAAKPQEDRMQETPGTAQSRHAARENSEKDSPADFAGDEAPERDSPAAAQNADPGRNRLTTAREEENPQEEAPSGSGLFSRIWGMLKTILGLPVRAVKFLFALPGKIAAAIQKIRVTIRGICDKISWWKEFLEDEHTREALSLVRQQAGGLIRHILPTKVSGEVTFGSEDPSLTGKILAVLGMSFPFHKNRIAVTPLFDGENHLTGRVLLKGRIYGIVVLAAALKIYFNKNTKYVISQWKSKA